MLTALILAAALTGQCQPGMSCFRGGYTYVQQPYYAPYIPPQPTPAPAPAPTPNVLRPVPPSPYRSAARGAGPTVAELDRKIDALAKQVEVLCGSKRAGPCTCGPACNCPCGRVTAFRFQ